MGHSLDGLNITREKNESSSISIKRSLQYLTFTLVNPLCQRPKMTQTFLKASLSFPFLAPWNQNQGNCKDTDFTFFYGNPDF